MDPEQFSCIRQVTKTVQLSLPMLYFSNEFTGIIAVLETWKRQYVKQLKGVVLGYSQVSLPSPHGVVSNQRAYIVCHVKATFDLFCPKIGEIVKGKIKRISGEHLGCLIQDTINVSLPLPHASPCGLEKYIYLESEVLFAVTDFSFDPKFLRVTGEITPKCLEIMDEHFQVKRTHVYFSDGEDVGATASKEERGSAKKKKKKDKAVKIKKESMSSEDGVPEFETLSASLLDNINLESSLTENPDDYGIRTTAENDGSAKKKRKDKAVKIKKEAMSAEDGVSELDTLEMSSLKNVNEETESNSTENPNDNSMRTTALKGNDGSAKKKKKKEKAAKLKTDAYSSEVGVSESETHNTSCLESVNVAKLMKQLTESSTEEGVEATFSKKETGSSKKKKKKDTAAKIKKEAMSSEDSASEFALLKTSLLKNVNIERYYSSGKSTKTKKKVRSTSMDSQIDPTQSSVETPKEKKKKRRLSNSTESPKGKKKKKKRRSSTESLKKIKKEKNRSSTESPIVKKHSSSVQSPVGRKRSDSHSSTGSVKKKKRKLDCSPKVKPEFLEKGHCVVGINDYSSSSNVPLGTLPRFPEELLNHIKNEASTTEDEFVKKKKRKAKEGSKSSGKKLSKKKATLMASGQVVKKDKKKSSKKAKLEKVSEKSGKPKKTKKVHKKDKSRKRKAKKIKLSDKNEANIILKTE